jgi:hypothetical protein
MKTKKTKIFLYVFIVFLSVICLVLPSCKKTKQNQDNPLEINGPTTVRRIQGSASSEKYVITDKYGSSIQESEAE